MFISHIDKIQKEVLGGEMLQGVTKQTAVGPEQGWEDHSMRFFTVSPGGHTPRHSHPWPHINYIVQGDGTLFHEGETDSITRGSVAYIPAGSEHQFHNSGTEDLVFICIVPKEGDK
jgi:quercetin dioxygenase-like cupin family protein